MPTIEERVAALETAMTEAQIQILLRAKSTEVVAIDSGRETAQLSQDTNLDALALRVSKLEQALTVLNTRINDSYRKNSNDALAENIVWATSSLGPVIKSADNTDFRIVVGNDGVLDTVAI